MSTDPNTILSRTANIDDKIIEGLPNSKKIYVNGSRDDIQVPMRKIVLANAGGG